MTAPKSQNGSLFTSSRVLSASNAPQPPSLDCMPSSQRRPLPIASRLPVFVRRSARITSAVSSVSA
jgi:hypothetical protein